MARRGDEVNSETFDVIDRTVQAVDFDFAAVAGAGVHLADVEGTAKELRGARLEFEAEGFEGLVLRGNGLRIADCRLRRGFGGRSGRCGLGGQKVVVGAVGLQGVACG